MGIYDEINKFENKAVGKDGEVSLKVKRGITPDGRVGTMISGKIVANVEDIRAVIFSLVELLADKENEDILLTHTNLTVEHLLRKGE